tara:strand:- start:359 stop:583 length:225 start_codon:yes stop_codon:yes gene_type:complete
MEDILKQIEIMLKDKQDGIESVHDAVARLEDKYESLLLDAESKVLGRSTIVLIGIYKQIIEELYEIKKHINDVS